MLFLRYAALIWNLLYPPAQAILPFPGSVAVTSGGSTPTWVSSAHALESSGGGTTKTLTAIAVTAGQTYGYFISANSNTVTASSPTGCGGEALTADSHNPETGNTVTAGFFFYKVNSAGGASCTFSVTLSVDVAVDKQSVVLSGGAFDVSAFTGQHNVATTTNAVSSGAATTSQKSACVGLTGNIASGGTIVYGTNIAWVGKQQFNTGAQEFFAQSAAGSITAAFTEPTSFTDPDTGLFCFH